MRNMRVVSDFLHRICSGPDLSALRRVDPSTVVRNRLQADDDIAVTFTSWELKVLKKSWIALTEQYEVGIALFSALFEKYPESKAVFGLKNACKESALLDTRVRRQALIIQDTISMVIDDLYADGNGLKWPLVVVGEAHVGFAGRGFCQDYFHTVGEALIDLIAQQPCVNRFKRWKLLRLWRRLLFFMVSCLVRGIHLGSTRSLETSRAVSRSSRTSRYSNVASMMEDELQGPPSRCPSSAMLEATPTLNERRPSYVQNQLLSMMALSVPMRL